MHQKLVFTNFNHQNNKKKWTTEFNIECSPPNIAFRQSSYRWRDLIDQIKACHKIDSVIGVGEINEKYIFLGNGINKSIILYYNGSRRTYTSRHWPPSITLEVKVHLEATYIHHRRTFKRSLVEMDSFWFELQNDNLVWI